MYYNSAAPRNERFNLHAYVSKDDVRSSNSAGSVTFTRIYQNRPDEYRYAVASQWDLAEHSERYLVWDLWSTMIRKPSNDIITPRPMLTHMDLDAAIVATQMLYGQE